VERRSGEPLDTRDQPTIETLESAVGDPLELFQTALSSNDQTVDVHVHAAAAERLKVGDPASPQSSSSRRVAAAQVLETNADLEDALVEVADRIWPSTVRAALRGA
jgi:hypothetical protein